ncbi:MAG: DUF3556 domain-containing protein [Chitinophagales bacterium]
MSFFKKLISPEPLPYDFKDWETAAFNDKVKMVCQAWAIQGFGAPFSTFLFYVFKIAFYVFMWFWFCSFSTELGTISEVGQWWFKTEAISKAIIWTVLIEVVGLGGASGPLTGRYVPPLGGITYFIRPGTIKAPMFPKLPVIGNDHRTIVDVVLYVALLFVLFRLCLAPQVVPQLVWPLLILFPLIGVLDRTIFLAARADIYFPMIICLMFPEMLIPALKIVWFFIWFWAAFSKLTPSFPSVVCVMVCNSPVFKLKIFDGFKKSLFVNYPEDLRPSSKAVFMAHFGTVVEFLIPISLIFMGGHPNYVFYALCLISLFHLFIFINFPMGVPLEWNVIMVYGAWLLFGHYPDVSIFAISEPILVGIFIVSFIALPVLGHLYPKYISFLLSMRYYAGTWAYSVWLFKGNAKEKIDKKITKTSKALRTQLGMLYDEDTTKAVLSRMHAFRYMHLSGRLLQELVPKAVDNIDDYEWAEGETLAGEVIGWNFGEAHLHGADLLCSVQKRCGYESGELRVIYVESPCFFSQDMDWKIMDAKDGVLLEGTGNIREVNKLLPWPVT